MKIVVTDETLITHQELHFRPEMDFPDYHVYPFTSAEQLLDRIGDADAIFINRIAISREVMKHCSHLKYIGLFSTGYNGVDIVAAKECGITVCNVPQYSSYAVAQHTMALLLDITNRVSVLTPMIKSGGWNDENIISVPSMDLCGKTLGIIGYGDIGRTFAGMAQSM
ncbi:MAG: NAD(P)-dependent oxidoreductase, partial [Oscillospiraceae bacterium]